MSNKLVIKISFLLVFVSIILSTVVSMHSLNIMADESQKDINLLLAARIHDEISGKLMEPVMVAETMANNRFLLDFLEREESASEEARDVSRMQDYLVQLKKQLAYDSVFVVSDGTKRYYSTVGLNKIIDVENDPHDIWYSTFVEANKSYDLDVDVDEVNGNVWTVFVNARLENNGRFLGACGVGVKMHSIQDLIAKYENTYGVKVNLIDANELVQVDTDEINIENAYLNNVSISDEASDEYVYQEDGQGGYMVSKYVENLGWYLVVHSEERMMDQAFLRIITLNTLLFAFVAAVFAIATYLMQRHTSMLEESSYLDELTGLRNRRAYEEEIARLSRETLNENFVYVNVDVNGLKTMNDTRGHIAGDELIRGAADCLQKVLGGYGHVFRVGGDEFAAILHIPKKEYEKVWQTLQYSVAHWKGSVAGEMSISAGYAPRWELHTSTLDEIIREADRRMYAAKAEYYEKAGRDRRRH